MKRFLTLLAFVALTITANAVIQSGSCGENVTFVLNDDGTLVISGSGDMANYASGSGLPWYNNTSKIIKVQIEDGVTSVGDYAFYGCSGLTSVTIPNSVTSIGNYAFSNCGKLETFYCYAENVPTTSFFSLISAYGRAILFVPAGALDAYRSASRWQNFGYIVPIGYDFKPLVINASKEELFMGETLMLSATVGSTIATPCTWVSSNPDIVKIEDASSGVVIEAIKPGTSSITATYFDGQVELKKTCNITVVKVRGEDVIYKDGIYYNIYGTNSTAKVTYKDSNYGSYSEGVSIPSHFTYNGTTYYVTEIEQNAFRKCENVTYIDIPNSVTKIGDYAFYGCSRLTSLYIPNSVTSIGGYAFYGCSDLASIEISNYVTTIGGSAFEGCSRIKSIEIPNSVTSLGGTPFKDCSSLTSITLGNSVKEITRDMFKNIPQLTTVKLGSSIKEIPNNAFSYCSNLTSVVMTNSVKSIGDNAFYYCSNLASIEIPNSVTSIGSAAFYHSGLKSVTIPNSVTRIYDTAFGYSGLISIEIPNSVTYWGGSEFTGCHELTTIIIDDLVENLGQMAFSYCENIKDVYCYAENPPSARIAFIGSNYSAATLHVPSSALESYRSADTWKDFGKICPLEPIGPVSLAVIDGEAYTNVEEKTYDELTFTKTFSSSVINKWNALYVPISINIEDYLDDFDFAEIFNISPTEDTNGDGEIDGKDANMLIVNKLKTGTTVPNKPYLIRPKNAGTYTFASADNVLYPAEEKSYSCSTMTDEYTFTGLYASKGVVGNDQYYMTINGVLDYSPTNTITVKPNRWIMTVKSRNGSSSSANAKAMSLSVIGEDESTTAIEHVNAVRNADVIYNLNGIKMDCKNIPAGIYIKNGKKVIVK